MAKTRALHVAGYQMAVTPDVDENARRIETAIERAAGMGADVLLTPEGSLSDYTWRFDRRQVANAVERVAEAAASRHVALVLGTCMVESDGRHYNQLRFYRNDGRYLGFHAKTLRCGTLERPSRGELEHYATAPLRTFDLLPGVTVGGLICNDLWANPGCTPMPDPHLTQRLARMGAQIIFHGVNGGRDGGEWSQVAWRYHEANLRMRARAAGVWIATVDNAAPETLPCSVPSGVIDACGRWVCRTRPVGEDLFCCDVPLDVQMSGTNAMLPGEE